jgi:hypothetical protein
MIWADRSAIGALILLLLVFGWLVTGENLHGWDEVQLLFVPPLVGAVVCWIVFRTLDFMFGGPQRRQRAKAN